MKKNMKQKACLALTMMMAMGATTSAFAASTDKVANPNKASVAVDGNAVAIGAYNIDGYNYFKLRDVAAILNGTGSNFEVGYDAASQLISLTTDKAYSATGKELAAQSADAKKAAVSNQKIMLDGKEVSMKAYLIDGYNYFQLRELGTNLGFEVTWDNEAKAINMVTAKQDAPEQETEEATDVQKLQKVINETPEFGEINLEGTFVGKPGDKIIVDKSLVFYGDDAVLENIQMVVNTDKQIWIDGVTFDGCKEAETAIHIKQAGADSAIVRCTIENYTGDAVVIDKVKDGSTFIIADNFFHEYGLAETKMDAAILLNATEKANVTYQIMTNTFKLSKDVPDEDKMDVALLTGDVANAVEVFSETVVEYKGNEVEKDGFKSNADICSDIAEHNLIIE